MVRRLVASVLKIAPAFSSQLFLSMYATQSWPLKIATSTPNTLLVQPEFYVHSGTIYVAEACKVVQPLRSNMQRPHSYLLRRACSERSKRSLSLLSWNSSYRKIRFLRIISTLFTLVVAHMECKLHLKFFLGEPLIKLTFRKRQCSPVF